MRTYLCQKEPGIKLDNKEETIVKETNLYKALTIFISGYFIIKSYL